MSIPRATSPIYLTYNLSHPWQQSVYSEETNSFLRVPSLEMVDFVVFNSEETNSFLWLPSLEMVDFVVIIKLIKD